VARSNNRNLYPKKKLTRADASLTSVAKRDLSARVKPRLDSYPQSAEANSGNGMVQSLRFITHITYPNGDHVHFNYDRQGQLVKIAGLKTYTKKDGRWYVRGEGGVLREMRYHNHSLMENGDLLFQTGEGRFHGKRPNGTEYDLHLTALGAHSQTDELGRVEMLLRTDGSMVLAIYIDPDSPPNIEEVSADRKQRRIWTRDQEYFVCDGQPHRHKLELTSNGNLSFIQDDQRVIITGDGTRLSEPVTKQRYGFDEEGRIAQIDYGRKLRQFGYIERTRELASVAVIDLASKSAFFHERIGESNEWSVRDHQGNLYATWSGTRHLAANGDYLYQERTTENKDRVVVISHICRPDGSESQTQSPS
jgi:hypothetical protein